MNEENISFKFLNGLPLSELETFLTVASIGSFTKAAHRMGIGQSALSHRIKRLEARLKIRLLNRTTRSLTPTAEGSQLLKVLQNAFGSIKNVLEELQTAHEQISGLIRLTAASDVARLLLWPKIAPILTEYPNFRVEIVNDSALTNIAREGFDAGVRLGETLEKDMISALISGPQRMVAVVSPSYFMGRSLPKVPQDLPVEECLCLRFSSGSLYHWEFEKEGQKVEIVPKGQFIANESEMILEAAKMGHGIGFVLEMHAAPLIKQGLLTTILEDWCPSFEGFHLYYPSRRHHSKAFNLLLETLRYRPERWINI